MSFTPELVAELEILALFSLDSTQEGLKIHQNADLKAIAAAKRLYEKDLITQVDGGYLTPLGRDAVEYTHRLLTILTSQSLTSVKLAELA
ncbi:TIGR02647 family protein [Pseudomonas sp. CCC3.1]|uniref:TIGR02647 family protein n=1 Tax=Pseudomonas sp. CCC3.1 TaxID=3048607 RepID=UPI002AC8ACCB|nr:TIGR02647 family protein [Pseudomonas sp. CCC3.1]MEB0207742.1 TIGR02647 family protein [Pseudomonas sp. CCC3.1]WPX36174.1 TIGR02647 family protein [Pseudomonas sp. CCC3.1]